MRKIIPGLMLGALVITASACSSGHVTLPQPQPTGPYSMKIVSGPSCATIGPGWLLVPEGASGLIFHVKSARSCVGDSVTAVIPFPDDPESKGRPFDLYNSFEFQKNKPA